MPVSEENKNKVRYDRMCAVGLHIGKVFWVHVLWPEIADRWNNDSIVKPWSVKNNTGVDKRKCPEVWNEDTGNLCGEWLLDHYAKSAQNCNFYGKFNNLYTFQNLDVKLNHGKKEKIRKGKIFADDSDGWDTCVLNAALCCFYWNSNIDLAYWFEPIVQFNQHRNDFWGHHVPTMDTAEYNRFCRTSLHRRGEVVNMVLRILDMTLHFPNASTSTATRITPVIKEILRPYFTDRPVNSPLDAAVAKVMAASSHQDMVDNMWATVLQILKDKEKAAITEDNVTEQVPPILAFAEGCEITLHQRVSATAANPASEHDSQQSYVIPDSFEGRFYAGRSLRDGLTGWNISDLEASSDLSREHCALTKFDVDAGTCSLVNVSTSLPLLILEHRAADRAALFEVRLHRGDKKVFVIAGVEHTIHLQRSRDDPILVITNSSTDASFNFHLYREYTYVLMSTTPGLSVVRQTSPDTHTDRICTIAINSAAFVAFTGLKGDTVTAVYDCVPPSHTRVLSCGSTVRLEASVQFTLLSINAAVYDLVEHVTAGVAAATIH